MSTAIVLDTETTGLHEPDVIELAYIHPMLDPGMLATPDLMITSARYTPRKAITLGAMATHHIIPEDLVGCPLWPGTWSPPQGVEYLIGHNIDFDWKAIGQPHVARIDTCALARHTWPDLDTYGLGALVYFLSLKDVAREKLKRAHSAAADVELCLFVLNEILKCIPGMMSWHQLWQASEKARIPTRMPFGKYGPKDGKPGRLIEEIRRFDPGYVKWCLGQADFDPYLIKALKGAA